MIYFYLETAFYHEAGWEQVVLCTSMSYASGRITPIGETIKLGSEDAARVMEIQDHFRPGAHRAMDTIVTLELDNPRTEVGRRVSKSYGRAVDHQQLLALTVRVEVDLALHDFRPSSS